MKKLLLVFLLAAHPLLAAAPAFSQAQLGAGQVMGNSSASQRPARAETLTSMLDRAFGSTRGAILERGASGWALIAPGTIGTPFISGGAGADPAYGVLGPAGGGTGLSALGTGVAAALGTNVGSAGAFVVFNGALGSPSSVGTLPAHSLSGTISGGGNQINNVIIGASTPLAGSFTSITGQTLALTSTALSTFSTSQTLTGAPGASTKLNRVNITSDDLNAAAGFVSAFALDHVFGGASAQGGRLGVQVGLRLTSPTNPANANVRHTGIVGGMQFENNEGGTNTGAGARGWGTGVTGYAFAWNSSATNLEELTGVQGEVFTATGSSVKNRIGVASLEEAGTSQGAGVDAAFAASSLSTGVNNFRHGLLFSNYRGGHPVSTNGTLIATSGAATVTGGIDWSSYTFTGNQLTGVGITIGATGAITGTLQNANALVVGRQGTTNPAFHVDTSNATGATGIKITASAAGNGTGLAVISSGANEAMFFDAKGTGPIWFGATASTGDINFGQKFGYPSSIGTGGAVTQITSRTTAVTLNKPTGAITLVSAAGTSSVQVFTVNNSTVVATDTIICHQKSGTDRQFINITRVAAGAFDIAFYSSGTTVEQPVFTFSVIKASLN